MTNKQRRDAQMAYIADDSIWKEMQVCRRKLQKLNVMDRSDLEGIQEAVKDLFGKSEDAMVNPPFYCDYGKHIEVGKNFFANYNCTILDVAKVKIGDNCQIWKGSDHWRQCLDWRKCSDLSGRPYRQ